MAYETASNLNPWRAAQVRALGPEPVEIALWDQLLRKLGLTELEACDAIVRDGDIGRSIQRFVRDSCRDHFVPEDVLHAMRRHREEAKETFRSQGVEACERG